MHHFLTIFPIIFSTYQKCIHTYTIQGLQDGCILKANKIARNTMELLHNRIYAHYYTFDQFHRKTSWSSTKFVFSISVLNIQKCKILNTYCLLKYWNSIFRRALLPFLYLNALERSIYKTWNHRNRYFVCVCVCTYRKWRVCF